MDFKYKNGAYTAKKEDGSRVSIRVSTRLVDCKLRYDVSVSKCAPGKRTWVNVVDTNNYAYRRKDFAERNATRNAAVYAVVPPDEVLAVVQAHWAMIGRPEQEDICCTE